VNNRVSGLYAVTPEARDTSRLLAQVRACLVSGARVVQYRNKSPDRALRSEQAQGLRALCEEHHATFIVNDDLDLASAVDADGIHLGRDDGSPAAARTRLGAHKLLGVSCYGELSRARSAVADGADYVAFGSFFPSLVKPGAVRPPVALLTEAKRTLSVPIVAIGGITLENASELIAAGADGIAVISALFGAPDIEKAARQFQALFGQAR
jgi:thiamine-phosphate pyrophosphorylase